MEVVDRVLLESVGDDSVSSWPWEGVLDEIPPIGLDMQRPVCTKVLQDCN